MKANLLPEADWIYVPLASFLLLQAGCLTAGTLEHARPHDCKYGKPTRITRAALSSAALFIEFQAVSSDKTNVPSRVLRIPLNDSSWLHDKRGRTIHLSEYVHSDTQVHDVEEWFLLPGDSIPPDAEELPVFDVETDNLGGLPEKVYNVSNNVQVFSVRYSPYGVTWAAPLIAIMSRPKPETWRTALIIANIREGCEQEKGWYALTPLAVVGDTALLPFYFIVGVISDFVE